MLVLNKLSKYTNNKYKRFIVKINNLIPYKLVYRHYNTIVFHPSFKIQFGDDIYEVKNPSIRCIYYGDYKITKNRYIKVSKRKFTTEEFANTIKLNFDDEYAYIMSK